MNLFDLYFTVMGGAPPPRPVAPPPAPAPVQTAAQAPSSVDNAVAAREKTAANKRRGRSSLITNIGGAPGLGDDDTGRKPRLGGY
tara:strand:+ start:507 stop:761 length:255 start_codon:yes stop_codon:yes gene_type:complete